MIGVPVARRLWPGEDSFSVILTPEELEAWQGIYKHPEEAHWWWIDYWWDIEDRPSVIDRDRGWVLTSGGSIYRDQDFQLPDGESPWLVRSGLRWGSLAAGATIELWSWNGREARYIRDVADITS